MLITFSEFIPFLVYNSVLFIILLDLTIDSLILTSTGLRKGSKSIEFELIIGRKEHPLE